MDGAWDYHTGEVSQRKQTWYDVAYMWNLKKGYKWTYGQNRNRVTDIENKPRLPGVKGGINWKTEIDIYTLLYIK